MLYPQRGGLPCTGRPPWFSRDAAYWPIAPEILQKTFLTWLPRMIRTTITTTAIRTRMRAYSTMPCPSSRLSSSRRRRNKLVSICGSPPFRHLLPRALSEGTSASNSLSLTSTGQRINGGLAEFLQRLRRLDHDAVTTTSNCVVAAAAADAREGLPKETLSMALVAQPSYWDRPPELLQKAFL